MDHLFAALTKTSIQEARQGCDSVIQISLFFLGLFLAFRFCNCLRHFLSPEVVLELKPDLVICTAERFYAVARARDAAFPPQCNLTLRQQDSLGFLE